MGYGIETYAIEAAAPYLPELKPVLPEPASAVLDALPAGPTLQQVVLEEKQTGSDVAIQELKKAEQHKEGSWQGVWRNCVDPAWRKAKTANLACTIRQDVRASRQEAGRPAPFLR